MTSRATFGTGLPRGLGWFGIALASAELLVPRRLAKLMGVAPDGWTPSVLRVLGARGLATAISVLAQPRRPLALWARVGGDLVDLGLLGLAAGTKRTSAARVAGAIAAVGAVMAIDLIVARRIQTAFERANQPATCSVTINRPPAEVYAFYRRLEQLPSFMNWLESVRTLDGVRSHWIAKLPLDGSIEWDAEIIEDVPGERIAWRTLAGSKLRLFGRVTFTHAPGRDMTEVRCEMRLGFTGTSPSTVLATLFARPQIKSDLSRLKQVLETGEVLVSDSSAHVGRHPAQPDDVIENRPHLFVPTSPTAVKGAAR